MAKEINKIENVVVVDGVSLTEKAIGRLKQLQEHDNTGIDYLTNAIQRGIRVIVKNLEDHDESEIRKITGILNDLSCICDWIEDLEKP